MNTHTHTHSRERGTSSGGNVVNRAPCFGSFGMVVLIVFQIELILDQLWYIAHARKCDPRGRSSRLFTLSAHGQNGCVGGWM